MTNMRTATIRVGAALMLATASLAVGSGTATAEPTGHQVKYVLTSATGASFQVNYLTAQPASKDAYNADPYAFLKKEEIGTPWEFTTTLEDAQWATIDASIGFHRANAQPNPHCEIWVDDQLVTQGDGPYTARCQLANWA
jgi:hypothetical protein